MLLLEDYYCHIFARHTSTRLLVRIKLHCQYVGNSLSVRILRHAPSHAKHSRSYTNCWPRTCGSSSVPCVHPSEHVVFEKPCRPPQGGEYGRIECGIMKKQLERIFYNPHSSLLRKTGYARIQGRSAVSAYG